jgi:hypothetical protein
LKLAIDRILAVSENTKKYCSLLIANVVAFESDKWCGEDLATEIVLEINEAEIFKEGITAILEPCIYDGQISI